MLLGTDVLQKTVVGCPQLFEKQKHVLVSGKKGINPEIFTTYPHLGLRFCSSEYSGKTKEEKLLPTLTIAESFTIRVHSVFLMLRNIIYHKNIEAGILRIFDE